MQIEVVIVIKDGKIMVKKVTFDSPFRSFCTFYFIVLAIIDALNHLTSPIILWSHQYP